MRDIRSDLKERLASAEGRRAQIAVTLKALDLEVEALIRLLELEDSRTAELSGLKSTPTRPIKEFITALTAGSPLTKDQIRVSAQAQGYDTDGRKIHAHVFNLVSIGALTRFEDDTFGSKKETAESQLELPAAAE